MVDVCTLNVRFPYTFITNFINCIYFGIVRKIIHLSLVRIHIQPSRKRCCIQYSFSILTNRYSLALLFLYFGSTLFLFKKNTQKEETLVLNHALGK